MLADDDSGVGLLSRLLVQITADGTFSVGVSTFPDLDLHGRRGDSGRYVLNISSYRGTSFPLAMTTASRFGLSTFAFPFQGTNWSSVFVNGNGNLTFGAANADFSRDRAGVAGRTTAHCRRSGTTCSPPAGLVIAEEKDRELQIHFVSVPEFLATGTNYFSVTLDRSGEITFDYGATNRSDAIVGITPGRRRRRSRAD